MDELRQSFESIREKLKDLFNRVNQLEAAPTINPGGGGGAPVDAQYLVLAFNATLTNERRLDFSARFATVDGGAGNDYDVDLAVSGVGAGVYGSATQVPQITVDAYGRLTNAVNVAISGVPPVSHPLLGSTYHSDVVNNGPTRGSLIYGNATPRWDELALGGVSGSIVTRDATDVLWSDYSLVGTAGKVYTFPVSAATLVAGGGSGVLNRIAYWSDNETITSAAGLTVDAANNFYLVSNAGGFGNSAATARLVFDSSGAQDYAYFSGCYVGINDTAPNYHLDVNGKIGINGVQTVYNAGALDANFLGSIFIGNGGASISHTGGIEGYYNYGNGHQSLNDLTTGHSNFAGGWRSLYHITTGYCNVAVGGFAGADDDALNDLLTNTYSIFIGYDARASANGNTNEVVIGGNIAVGHGSNTTTIGNAATTDFYALGNHHIEDGHWVGSAAERTVYDTTNNRIDNMLSDALGASTLRVLNSGATVVMYVTSLGNAYFSGDIAVNNGKFVGISGDVRTVYDSTLGAIIEQLNDLGGTDEWRVYDSASVKVAYINSDGEGYFASKVGIGAVPATALHVVGAVKVVSNGDKFSLFEDDVAEANGYLKLTNATGAANVLVPYLAMRGNTTGAGYNALIEAICTNDAVTDTGPVITYRASHGATAVTNRVLFQFQNYTTNVITVLASGDTGIGTVTPGAKLHLDQSSSSGAKPVLTLDQADEDFVLCKFIGYASAASANRTFVSASDFTT
ncbi:MAG: hypothetical protein WC449_05220, partial [Candidatus Paceibacterota bacterium]